MSQFHLRRNLIQAAALVPFQAVRGTAQNSAVKIGVIGAGKPRHVHVADRRQGPARQEWSPSAMSFDEQIETAKAKIPAPDAKAYKRLPGPAGERRRCRHDRNAGIPASRALRSRRQIRQAHLYREARRPRCRRLQARDADCRRGRSQAEHHLRIPAALWRRLRESQADARFGRHRQNPRSPRRVSEVRAAGRRARSAAAAQRGGKAPAVEAVAHRPSAKSSSRRMCTTWMRSTGSWARIR